MKLLAAAVLLGSSLSAGPAPFSAESSATAFKARDQALLDAVDAGDRKTWDAALSSDALYVDENGEVISRADLLTQLEPLPGGISGSLKNIDYTVIRHGETAGVVMRTAEAISYHGQPLAGQYLTTETWRREGSKWKLALVHVYAVNRDPPAIKLPGNVLPQYVGRYRAASDLTYEISLENGQLVGTRIGGRSRPLAAELRDVLFTPGQPRSRKIFERDASGTITSFRDRREGNDIVWRKET